MKNDKKGPPSRERPAEVPRPTRRSLRIYSVDPSAGSVDNLSTVHVPWEKLKPGPIGERLAVVDYDPARRRYYPPVDLEHPFVLARDGLDPSECDPRFHQQMVYAVAARTIEMFETALGRRIHWRRADHHSDNPDHPEWRKQDRIDVLHLYPHAMEEANAYYSPQAKGILFGYFAANATNQGRNLPGQRVFTCLSHDIIAHEITHAIIDGIRTYFTEATNPDALAFHEAFADIVALFAHFSQFDALVDTIQRTGGRLYQPELAAEAEERVGQKDAARTEKGADGANGKEAPAKNEARIAAELRQINPLIQLAQQFGEALGTGHGLRSALGTPPSPEAMASNLFEPHARGSILVAAVFDAYFSVYTKRTADLFRIFYAGGGRSKQAELPEPLAQELARRATSLSRAFFRICVRSLDYCPPVDLTFGDFLRALITVATEIDPDDDDGIRDAIMQSFRLRGIFSETASFFSEDALRWQAVRDDTIPPIGLREIEDPDAKRGAKRTIKARLMFGNPGGMTEYEKNVNGRVLRSYVSENRAALGLDPDLEASVPSFHAMFRAGADGRLEVEMVVEAVQLRRVPFDESVPDAGAFPLRGGVTLIIGQPPLESDGHGHLVTGDARVKYLISKPISGTAGARRAAAQRDFSLALGHANGKSDDPAHFQINFALLHSER